MSNQITPPKQENESKSATGNSQSANRNTNHLDHIPESLADDSSSEEAPELDEIFELMMNYRRRCVLLYLSSGDGTGSLSDIAERIAGWENDKEPRLITSDERKRVYVGLYQSHLPKMDDMGAISFNKPRGSVEKGPYFEAFHHYLPSQEESNESIVRRFQNRFVGRLNNAFQR